MARRRRRKPRFKVDAATLSAAVGGVLAVSVLLRVIREHPVLSGLAAAALLAVAGGWAYLRWTADNRLMRYERDVAVTDHMSGPDFEQYVARLLRDSGCRGVRVSGGAGDLGADVTGRTPDGRRLVVQCKRYAGRLGSPDVQRFAGTARDIHGADMALLVTTGRPTAQALDVARRCRITLVDRRALAEWISTGASPLGAGTRVSERGRP